MWSGMTIETAFGRKQVLKRVGASGEYYYTAATKAAPNGEWWILNPQKGYVPVPSNSRALQYALKHYPAR